MSDNLPQTGAERKEKNPLTAIINPFWRGLSPNLRDKAGYTVIRIEKPMMSEKTANQRGRSWGYDALFLFDLPFPLPFVVDLFLETVSLLLFLECIQIKKFNITLQFLLFDQISNNYATFKLRDP